MLSLPAPPSLTELPTCIRFRWSAIRRVGPGLNTQKTMKADPHHMRSAFFVGYPSEVPYQRDLPGSKLVLTCGNSRNLIS